jgi:hypothetical protein
MSEKKTPPGSQPGGAAPYNGAYFPTLGSPLLFAGPGHVKRQPAGKWSENRPDASGRWHGPAPHLMPCCDCGELTSLLGRCARCRSWAAFVEAREAGDREQAAYHLGMFRRAGGVL